MVEERQDAWREVIVVAERIEEGVPFRFLFRVTLRLRDGRHLPLIARPELIDLVDRLDILCRERSPKLWNQFTYRFYQEADGPSFEARFGYPTLAH
jgi:hypothetical protein